MQLEHFYLEEYSFDKENHILFKENFINDENTNLISNDINSFIMRNLELKMQDKITNVYLVLYEQQFIGIVFVNYHPKELIDNECFEEEIEICLGILSSFRGQHLGTLLEKELSEKLLSIYPQFPSIVARIEDENLYSIKVALKAGYECTSKEVYEYKRKDY